MINLFSPTNKKHNTTYVTKGLSQGDLGTIVKENSEENLELNIDAREEQLCDSSLTETDLNKTNDFNMTKYANEPYKNKQNHEESKFSQEVVKIDSKKTIILNKSENVHNTDHITASAEHRCLNNLDDSHEKSKSIVCMTSEKQPRSKFQSYSTLKYNHGRDSNTSYKPKRRNIYNNYMYSQSSEKRHSERD